MTTDEIRKMLDAIDAGEKVQGFNPYNQKLCDVESPMDMFPKMRLADPRYPFTYTCDYLREMVGVKISRADASTLIRYFASATKYEELELAEIIADEALEKPE